MTTYLASPRLSAQREGWSWAVGLKDLQKAPECPEVPAFKTSGMAWHVHDRTGQHMVTLFPELGTLSAAGWLSQAP